MWRTLPLAILLLSSMSCRLPDEAPGELSELLSFSFGHYDPHDWTNDISLADAAVNLEAWFSGEVENAEDYDAELGFEARLTDATEQLTNADLAHLTPAPGLLDAPSTVGVVVALVEDCTLDEIVDIYAAPNQMDFFPDNYVAYERTDLEGIECFIAGDCLEARWLTHMTQEQSFPAATWDAGIWNAMRRLDAIAPGGQAVRGLMNQAWMEEPAQIEPAGLGELRQNYQLEFILERPSGGLLHVYPQWVEFDLGSINTEAAVFLNAYIDGIRDYVRTLESHCG